jgi:hypothetical protein
VVYVYDHFVKHTYQFMTLAGVSKNTGGVAVLSTYCSMYILPHSSKRTYVGTLVLGRKIGTAMLEVSLLERYIGDDKLKLAPCRTYTRMPPVLIEPAASDEETLW